MLLVLSALLLLASYSEAASIYHAGCHSAKPAFGPSSNFSTPVDLLTNQKHIKSVANGHHYTVTLPNGCEKCASVIDVIHLYGGPKDFGTAMGQLLGDKVKQFIEAAWLYLEEQVANALIDLPKWLGELIGDLGLDAALDATEVMSRPFTNPDIYHEIKALAHASGVEYQRAVRVHMLAGLTQGHCSFVGAWGSALDPTSSCKTLQLRALDWNMDGPFRDYASVIVYHPTSEYGHPFINVGFPGLIGALTGISSQSLAISEIGVSYPDAMFKGSRVGIPFIFLLRDVLQYDKTVDDSISRMANAHRTGDFVLGVGDGKLSYVRGFAYSREQLHVYGSSDLIPVNATWHQPVKDAVYNGMDWICPTFNYVLGQQLQKYHGKLTPEIAMQHVTSVLMSGDNHLAWYDLTNQILYASFAAPNGVAGPEAAYWRQYLKVDAQALYALKQ